MLKFSLIRSSSLLAALSGLLAPNARAFSPLHPQNSKYGSAVGHPQSATSSDADSTAMPYEDDKMIFYAMGVNFAMQTAQLDLAAILNEEGMDLVLDGFCFALRSDGDMAQQRLQHQSVLKAYGPALNAILNERNARRLQQEQEAGAAWAQDFLKQHARASKTESGLIYFETEAGSGTSPTVADSVQVHYHGTLRDGTVFDSSVDRGESIRLPLNGVIPGWTEGLQLMKEGGKATFLVPPNLAYGDGGSGGTIPPGATLHFDIELLQVITPEQEAASAAAADDATELLELPDGSKIRVPKGVKMRVVEEEAAAE